MARINIEDDIESRQEFWRLFEVVKDRDKCLGMLVRFFRLAQKHFGKIGPITFDELEAQGLAPMVETGWAVACDGGYQALGAEKQFAWYRDQVAASKLGGEANRKKWEAIKSLSAIPSSSRPATQPASEPSRQDSSLTLTLSPALTLSKKKEEEQQPLSSILEPQQIAALQKQFGDELVNRCLKDAESYYRALDPYRQSKTTPHLSVQRYLKNERDKPPNPFDKNRPVRTIAEMIAAGEVEA